jgi:phage terminase large subunit GpA-like protein
VDVQPDRLEVEVKGWGRDFESWSLEVKRIEGEITKPDVWRKLDEFLETKYVHERGVVLPIAATFIDSGFNQGEVMNYTKTRASRRIWASKGMSNFTAVPLGKRNQNNKPRVWMYPVGVSSIKKTIYQRLALETPGPGYMHFSEVHNDADYFDQLTCEKLVPKNVNGRVQYEWKKPEGRRNEALDINVYAYAAMLSLWDDPQKGLQREYARILDEAKRLAESRKHNPDQLSLLDDPVVPGARPETTASEVELLEVDAAKTEQPHAAQSSVKMGNSTENAIVQPNVPRTVLAVPARRRRLVVTRCW